MEEEEEEEEEATEENKAEVVHEEEFLRLRRGPTTRGLFVPDHHYHYCLKLCLGFIMKHRHHASQIQTILQHISQRKQRLNCNND